MIEGIVVKLVLVGLLNAVVLEGFIVNSRRYLEVRSLF